MTDLGISTEDFYLFGEGIATQSIRINKSTQAAKYRVSLGDVKEFLGNLTNESTKISVEMILYDLVDYREKKVLTTGLDQINNLREKKKEKTLWKIYTGLENDTLNKYNLEYNPISKTSFAVFDNLMIESVNYSIDNSFKTSAFRVSLQFTEIRTEIQEGIEKPNWVTIYTGASPIQHRNETPTIKEEEKIEETGEDIKNICDLLGNVISDVFSKSVDVGKKGVEAAGSFIGDLFELAGKIICGTEEFPPLILTGVPPVPSTPFTSAIILKTIEKLSHE